MSGRPTTLIFGWGNPGRLDDGLGPAFVEALASDLPPGVTVDSDYQLTMEDAAEVAQHDRVLFVDADRTGPEPFRLQRIGPERTGSSFSTHSVSPGAVLSLSRDLFGSEPEAWLLGIRGHRFDEFGEEISEPAQANLEQAVRFIRTALESDRFPDERCEGEPCQTLSA